MLRRDRSAEEKKLTDKQWTTDLVWKTGWVLQGYECSAMDFFAATCDRLFDYRDPRGVPTWKRIEIVESLLVYSKLHFGGDEADLGTILIKLRKLQREDPTPGDDRTIDEIVGRINPAEPDVIQEFRRSMRLEGIVHP